LVGGLGWHSPGGSWSGPNRSSSRPRRSVAQVCLKATSGRSCPGWSSWEWCRCSPEGRATGVSTTYASRAGSGRWSTRRHQRLPPV